MATGEMLAALSQSLKEDCLNCIICSDDFKDPIILPCHHSFCRKCMGDSVKGKLTNNKFRCPLCDKLTDMPKNGVQGFPVDVRIANMLAKIDALSKGVPCSSCDTKEDANWNCKTCRQAYCNKCAELHRNIQGAENHQMNRISAAGDARATGREMAESLEEAKVTHYCPKHKKEELIFYCITDDATVCRNCVTVKHRDHDIIDAEDRADEIRKEINDVLEQGESNFLRPITNYVTFTERIEKECQQNYEETANSINEHFQKIQVKIEATKADCLQKLQNNHAYQMKLLKTTTNDMSGRLGRYYNERKLWEILKTNTADVQLIKMHNKLKDTFAAWQSNDWQRPYRSTTVQLNAFTHDVQQIQQYLDMVSVDVETRTLGTPMLLPLSPDEIHPNVQEAEELSSFDTAIYGAYDVAVTSNGDTIIIDRNKDVGNVFDAQRKHKLNIACPGARSVAVINKDDVLIATTTTIRLYDNNYKHVRDVKTFRDINNIAVNEDNDIAVVDRAAKAVVVIDLTGKEKVRLDQLEIPKDVVFNINGDIVVYDDDELKVYSDNGVMKQKKQHLSSWFIYEKYIQRDMYGHILAKGTQGNRKLLLYSRDLSVNKELLECNNYIDAFTVQKDGSFAVVVCGTIKLNIYKYIK